MIDLSKSLPIETAPINTTIWIYLPWKANNKWRLGKLGRRKYLCDGMWDDIVWKIWIDGKTPRFSTREPTAWKPYVTSLNTQALDE